MTMSMAASEPGPAETRETVRALEPQPLPRPLPQPLIVARGHENLLHALAAILQGSRNIAVIPDRRQRGLLTRERASVRAVAG